MYQIFLTQEAKRQLQYLDRRYQKALAQALQRLGENPKIGTALRRELKGKFKLRVSRYRIIFQFDHQEKKIWIVTIDHRKDVYR